ncbi:adenosylmethionine--8-amino-7-oxononanoate transaminase [Marinomonas sp. 2405UD68-3]|uniref:adenosylmethionine--8-amino-7-oxononanoate transaminase n=1 Tax=Marinomonas sp. 2405UD68-3 TaxID=3391835 RepID=UPI0039C95B52
MPLQKTDAELIQLDKELLWHPYTSMSHPTPHFLIKKAEGSRITLSNNQTLIDGMSSWWSVIHGYNHPTINEAMKSQIDDFSHVMFGGLTHEPAIELANTLIKITPKELSRVFFSDSGSVAVEVALKMAIQYWHSAGNPDKKRFITPKNGYHGDTFAAMSVCDPVNGMHNLFKGTLTEQFFIPSPPTGIDTPIDEKYLARIHQLIKKHHTEIAGFILEPVVQNAGGMRFYNPMYLDRIKTLCDDFNILLIFDEIATGFGRTGKMFATNHCNITPDIMCVGKALTGGYITLAATITNDKVALGISDKGGVFMHGPTFMGNPLACSAANASLSLLASYDLENLITNIETNLSKSLNKCKALENVANIRCFGAIGVVELITPIDQHRIQPLFVEQGVWIRPFGKLIYLMPPFVITNKEIETLGDAIYNVIASLEQ